MCHTWQEWKSPKKATHKEIFCTLYNHCIINFLSCLCNQFSSFWTRHQSLHLPPTYHTLYKSTHDTRVSCYSIHPPLHFFTQSTNIYWVSTACQSPVSQLASVKACCDTTVTTTVPVSGVYVLTGAVESSTPQQGTAGEKQGTRRALRQHSPMRPSTDWGEQVQSSGSPSFTLYKSQTARKSGCLGAQWTARTRRWGCRAGDRTWIYSRAHRSSGLDYKTTACMVTTRGW